jgi:hypothetical protein
VLFFYFVPDTTRDYFVNEFAEFAIDTNINGSLTLCPRRGSKVILDILPRHPHFSAGSNPKRGNLA